MTGRRGEGGSGKPTVLICSSYYWPESSGNAPYVTGLAEFLAESGRHVVVCTGYPHYPEWRSSASGLRVVETRSGVEVHRRRHYVPPRQSALHRALYETSLFVTGLPVLRLPRHPDVVLGVTPTLAAASLALVAARSYRVPAGIVFQDLMGRAAEESGVKGGGAVAGIVRRLELRLARVATAIAVVSDGFQAYFQANGIDAGKIVRVRNWDLAAPATGTRAETRARFRWRKDDFVCLYAGSMGHKQGLDTVLHAAAALPPGFRVVLAGDGSDRVRLEEVARSLRLANVEFRGVQPAGVYESLLRAADVLLVSQRPSVADMSLASKLTSYFAAGRPVVAALGASSETAREVVASGGGILVPAAAPDALAAAILGLRADPARATDFGERGRRYALDHLSAGAALAQYDRFIESLLETGSRPLAAL
jgi:glycosyltransferase involved in cell wall biosynthesis